MLNKTKFALTGSESLLGREIRDIAAGLGSEFDLQLIAGDEQNAGALTEFGDEPTLIGALNAESLVGNRAVLLAGSEDSSRKAIELLKADPETAIIDLTYAAEEHPEARLRAPSLESEAEFSGRVHVIAHPAAIALAIILRRLQAKDPIRRCVVQVFAPVSELGVAGIQELQDQTVGMLSFKNLPKAVFDAQLSFNLLARYGQEAPVALEQTELRIDRHLATLLALPGDGEGAPMPSLRLIQAPVFHGYSFSLWVQFEGNPGVEAIESSLASEWIDVRGAEFEPPSNVGQAGQSGISVGAIEEDRNDPDACWFWVVTDNLRLSAENAIAVARQLR